ncbi:TPA: TraI domain-containing protein [Salmonella enterica]
MWHKVRKMFMGSSPQSHDRLDDSDNSKDEDALLQRGYFKPLPATSLLDSENRQHLLQQLWENSLLPRAQYEQYFHEPLKSCISLMQRLRVRACRFRHYGLSSGAFPKSVGIT